ncbi:putative bifunctional diguanylate cyclase/phosphodiesterase [Flocculibacter collagenilyticus]|uniref:putative bifunctional diguanylate cyclase/phosphodiesterase n=1 Tax=Flocculibacter collagenilyticus TaxID=2744479 RepID=UPI001F475CB1|nr:GGDEF domain-containing phosphodiesterase [Flocculibacter collagenilyticus]
MLKKRYPLILIFMMILPAFVSAQTSEKASSLSDFISWQNPYIIGILLITSGLALCFAYISIVSLRKYQGKIEKSEARLRLSLWSSGEQMWDWNIAQGVLVRSNNIKKADTTINVCGIFPPNKNHIHPQDVNRVAEALKDHLHEKTEFFEVTYRVKNEENEWRWMLDRGKVVETDNRHSPVRMTGTVKDISQMKETQERLSLFAKCIDNISDGIVIYDRSLKIIEINPSYTRITGKDREAVLGQKLAFSQYPNTYIAKVIKCLHEHGSWYGEIDAERANGEKYQAELTMDVIKGDNNQILHYVAVFSDISTRKSNEAELKRISTTDKLTGLPNRNLFYTNMQNLVNKNKRHALMVFDLDNFKKINDSLGHKLGDNLLCRIAERLKSITRQHDSIYRLGGDEFALILEDTNDIHTITSTAKDILKIINRPFPVNSHELVISSSIGIVLFPEDGQSPESLLKNADTAMYHAKKDGNKYLFFSDRMNKQAVKRLQIENLIRHGLKNDYFSVFYQPKMDLRTGKLMGMEALVRFVTPKSGLISPASFIPVAEETGQIVEIGEVVLRKSCQEVKRWIDAGIFDGRVAVNLSARQFSQPNLCQLIDEVLDEANLHSSHLELEITEGTVMNSPTEAIKMMRKLRSRGIHLAMDDFGTGYSSLAYLKQFPLNTLKIDKAFIDDVDNKQGQAMVNTIVTIAHNLDLDVVAEGVESEKQLNYLKGANCEVLQGYFYSKPLSSKDFEAFVIKQNELKAKKLAEQNAKAQKKQAKVIQLQSS